MFEKNCPKAKKRGMLSLLDDDLIAGIIFQEVAFPPSSKRRDMSLLRQYLLPAILVSPFIKNNMFFLKKSASF